MNLFTRWPRASLALAYVALPTLFSLVGGVESLLNNASLSWSVALGREVVYWTAWVILLPPMFRLCRWLHEGPQRWPRYLLGLTLGAAVTVVLIPLLYEIVRLGSWAIAWKFSWVKDAPPAFWADYKVLFMHLITASVVIFASTVIAWYAVTNYREAKESRLETAELGAMLQQAQLQALRSQLNPHFLFNTLNSIAELTHENPRQAEQMLLQLGELLRKSLKTQALEVPLSEEIDFIRSYLAIEQMRLGDRLEVIWRIEPAALGARVPSLILQPIVENAIKHGIAVSVRRGRLEISATRLDEQLQLEVRDNGPGLNAHGINHGIGIGHTRTRLQRLYGSRASFQLRNDQGLVASMLLPWSEGTDHLS
ncbi:MAG: sensor histidine kinase [Opitutus sp.]